MAQMALYGCPKKFKPLGLEPLPRVTEQRPGPPLVSSSKLGQWSGDIILLDCGPWTPLPQHEAQFSSELDQMQSYASGYAQRRYFSPFNP
jgi:hypothetical protein